MAYTLSSRGDSRIEIKQSVFIGCARRIQSPEDASDFIAEQRSLYPDARHSCYAWVLSCGVNMSKYSDDGEPSGTAGMPLLNIIQSKGLTDCAVCVTRYFGGILLGKGGLARAYTEAGTSALAGALPVEVAPGTLFTVKLEYPDYDKFLFECNKRGYDPKDSRFGDGVELDVLTESSKEEEFLTFVTDITSGRAKGEKSGTAELVLRTLELF
ncbi:MAG: YigZ family protein [Clostridiales bacterium]|nr:YigZ family protein [Clostridiales bacterium]